jgi:hypothetical protein
MLTFHYIICDVPKKDKYHVKKLIFIENKLNNTDNMILNLGQVSKLKNSISEKEYTLIKDSKLNIDSFLKNINLMKPL